MREERAELKEIKHSYRSSSWQEGSFKPPTNMRGRGAALRVRREAVWMKTTVCERLTEEEEEERWLRLPYLTKGDVWMAAVDDCFRLISRFTEF